MKTIILKQLYNHLNYPNLIPVHLPVYFKKRNTTLITILLILIHRSSFPLERLSTSREVWSEVRTSSMSGSRHLPQTSTAQRVRSATFSLDSCFDNKNVNSGSTNDKMNEHNHIALFALFAIGLCGTFNDNKDDDLTMPNGTISTETTKEANQFSLSWR